MLTLITVCHLEERLTIVDGELRNGRAGAKNFPVAPDVVAVDLGENPPVLQPPIKRLVTRPDAPLHLEVLGGVGVVLGALHLVRVESTRNISQSAFWLLPRRYHRLCSARHY